IIEEWTSDRSTEQAISEMEAADAIVGPIYDMGDIFEDDQYEAREDIVEIEDDELGTLRTANTVPKFSRTPGSVEHAGPRHGEHNDEVYLSELGLGRKKYEYLCEEEVI
ncbi:MAG TPA: CoA transferase, partial [Halococcus sp.]|nr:CoA transferase [Halococcus sp.]